MWLKSNLLTLYRLWFPLGGYFCEPLKQFLSKQGLRDITVNIEEVSMHYVVAKSNMAKNHDYFYHGPRNSFLTPASPTLESKYIDNYRNVLSL